jgi:hypothetical protein
VDRLTDAGANGEVRLAVELGAVARGGATTLMAAVREALADAERTQDAAVDNCLDGQEELLARVRAEGEAVGVAKACGLILDALGLDPGYGWSNGREHTVDAVVRWVMELEKREVAAAEQRGAARALKEAADAFATLEDAKDYLDPARWLNDRANAIEAGEPQKGGA